MKNSKHLLLEARAERIRPGLDDKFLTSLFVLTGKYTIILIQKYTNFYK
jgi:uncharacterized protein YyaL (SSP411 family)